MLQQHLVGDGLVVDAVEGVAGGALVGEQKAVVADVGGHHQARGQDAHVVGVQRDERLVLDHALQRREGAAVAHVLEAQEAVDAEHQVGAALVAAQHLDEERAPVLGLAEVGGGAAGVDAGAREPGQRDTGAGHGLHDGGAAGSLVGRSESEQHRGAAHDAAAQGQDEIRRHFAAGDGAEDQAEDHGDPAGPPPRAADPGRAKDDDGDAAGDPVRVDLGLGAHPVRAMQGPEQFGLAELLHDALVQGREQQLREQGRRDEHHEQPVPAAPQRDDEDRGEEERGEALEDQVDDARHASGQRVEGVDQVAFEADERVGRARGEQQPDQDEQHADDQAQHI